MEAANRAIKDFPMFRATHQAINTYNVAAVQFDAWRDVLLVSKETWNNKDFKHLYLAKVNLVNNRKTALNKRTLGYILTTARDKTNKCDVDILLKRLQKVWKKKGDIGVTLPATPEAYMEENKKGVFDKLCKATANVVKMSK